jgi:hypothetical protein
LDEGAQREAVTVTSDGVLFPHVDEIPVLVQVRPMLLPVAATSNVPAHSFGLEAGEKLKVPVNVGAVVPVMDRLPVALK